ncbi:hypothetical protein JXB41_02675 [Candidatus Woesearchaeota archaeon]|nr:hypothetical protein [Candidatus Woesearchaeota archaeon]
MNDEIIEISSEDKSTTIRLKEKTKKMMEALSLGKETHEEILLRLIKIANQLAAQSGTEIYHKGGVIGTKYERLNRIFSIKRGKKIYSVVCTFNDLTIIDMLRKGGHIQNYITNNRKIPQWELDLEIVNIKEGKGDWISPAVFKKNHDKIEFSLIYFACVKQVLEEAFDISIYEIITEDDLFNIEKWDKLYKRYNLSRDSFYHDIEGQLKMLE